MMLLVPFKQYKQTHLSTTLLLTDWQIITEFICQSPQRLSTAKEKAADASLL